ncbi:hypothetical protein O1611_g8979 [Lasiodiplodia mahajangana]|uniref:Uncharacterized protein n=1 Tax=Lasiodiplodia mahajangana TaxID=1108764 RepID=A0ACC2JB47_9PEZI|nr:hypothetical protein O1611_g8979 [Lasiodiplodia mahajangana]
MVSISLFWSLRHEPPLCYFKGYKPGATAADWPVKVRREDIRDIDLSIRFKHGTQTIFIFIDSMTTFGHVQEELLDILKERYPSGITTSVVPPKTTKLPNSASQIKFAILQNKADPTQGWKPVGFESDDTPVDKGFQDNMMVAFAIVAEDADDADDVDFEVEFPSYDEEVEDTGEL